MNSRAKVCDFMSHENSVKRFFKKGFNKVFTYPQNDVREVAKIMADINMESLPVLLSPWNKKLVGYIELKRVKKFLND